jgi:hypothetical protein
MQKLAIEGSVKLLMQLNLIFKQLDMENLGNVNILFNKYKIGETLPTNKQISFIGMIQDWIYIKDNVLGIEEKRTSETKYIFTLNIIDLEILQQILYSLIHIYKKKYIYAKKDDFVEHVLLKTVFDLKELVSVEFPLHQYIYKIPNYQSIAYFKYDHIENELIDFIVEDDKDDKYYIHYANKVLELIYNLDFDNLTLHQIDDENINIKTSVLNKNKLTNKQKALIAVYNNEPVTRPINGNDIYNLWLKVNNSKDRLANPESKSKYKNKVELLEIVIENLLEPNKQKAIDDLNTFKSRYEKDYL